jgi:CO/xanthine dehydrogenase FAD-binding subunit
VKSGKFTYHEPTTLTAAFQLLAELGDDVKIIAGGQSLIPVMNLRLAQPEHLIDINTIQELIGIKETNEHITVGAVTCHADIETAFGLKAACPILPEAARRIGHLAIRNRGTIGGSLVNADPAAEWPLIAILMDAEMTIHSGQEVRILSARDFIQSVYTSAVEEYEILTTIQFPVLKTGEGWSIQQICRRVGDFAIVAVAVTLRLQQDGTLKHLRLCLGGMDVTPLRMTMVEKDAVGKIPDAAWIEDTSKSASKMGSPGSDMHANAIYRQEICEVLTTKALNEALHRARKQEGSPYG